MFTQSQIDKFHKEGIIVAKNLIQGRGKYFAKFRQSSS